MPENRPTDYKKPSSRIAGAVLTATERARNKRAAASKAAAYQRRVSDAVIQAGNTKQESANRVRKLAETRKEYAAADHSRNTNAAQRAAGTGHRTHGIKNPEYKDVSTQDYTDRPSLMKDKSTSMRPTPSRKEEEPTPPSPNKRTGAANKKPLSGPSPRPSPPVDKNFKGKGLTKSLRPRYRPGG